MQAAQGMIALYAAVANANHMATWGGADLLLGTNPLAIGVPTGDQPLVFDMATSIVAYGTVKKYALRGLTMPEAARVLGISLATAERYWTYARTWLYAELSEPTHPASTENRSGG